MTASYVAIGGPKHGEDMEDAGPIVSVMFQPPNDNPLVPTPALTTKYIKRNVDAETPEGTRFRQFAYVHESVSQQEFIPLLSNILIGRWILSGEELNEQDISNRQQPRHSQMADAESRSPNGLYLPG